MIVFKKAGIAFGLIVLVVSCSLDVPKSYAADAGEAPPRPAAGKLLFLKCAACHAIADGGGSRIGPNLSGVVGRKAGSLSGYSYSPAMKAQDFVWDADHLDRWLTKPNDLVPGTAMAFAGLPKAQDRQALIAYLTNPAP
jgi:cytochrome c